MTTAAVGSPGPRGAHGHVRTRRQAELLSRLESLFLADGFIRFTLDDLASRLRCSKSTLYALAPSKEQLATAVVAGYFRGAGARLEAAVSQIADARRRIDAYLTGIAAELRPARPAFFADVAAFEPARAAYEANARFAAERIHAFIAEGVAQGVFGGVHAAFVAEMVNLTIGAIQRGEIGARTGLSTAEAFAELATFTLAGLAAS